MMLGQMRRTHWVGLMLAVLLLVARTSQAGDPRAESKAHYEKGSVLFDLQRYEEAAVEYEAAYEAKPDAAFLFNAAQAYRLAKKPERAIRAYTSYLRRMPQAKNRAEIDGRIAEMKALEEQQRAEAEAAAAAAAAAKVEPALAPVVVVAPPPPSTPATVPPRVRTLKWAGLGIGIGGLALGLVGAGVYGVGHAAFKDLDQPSPALSFDPDTERRMNTLRPTGVALMIVGVAATATGFALFGVNLKKERAIRGSARAVLPPATGSMEVQR